MQVYHPLEFFGHLKHQPLRGDEGSPQFTKEVSDPESTSQPEPESHDKNSV